MNILNIKAKEGEFQSNYNNIPEKEKVLRSIERELEIKEALFLLLLQKREEAAINYAVVKPSIKVIDNSRHSPNPISPNHLLVYLGSGTLGFLIPIGFLFVFFTLILKFILKSI